MRALVAVVCLSTGAFAQPPRPPARLEATRLGQLLGFRGHAEAPRPVARASSLPVRLLGTLVAALPERSLASVVVEQRRVRSVWVGDQLLDGEVVSIDRGAVLVRRPSGLETLSVGAASLEPATEPRRAPTRESVVEVAAGTWRLDRATLDAVLANPMSVGSQVQLVPRFENGRAVGVTLRWVQPGSLVERLGAKPGDVLLSVNGVPSADLRGLMQLGMGAGQLSSVMVELLRNGQPVTQRYELGP